MNDDDNCWSCGYDLRIHDVAGQAIDNPDPNGGCPENEIDAAQRWGWM